MFRAKVTFANVRNGVEEKHQRQYRGWPVSSPVAGEPAGGWPSEQGKSGQGLVALAWAATSPAIYSRHPLGASFPHVK